MRASDDHGILPTRMMHSVELFLALGGELKPTEVLDYALRHQRVIVRFGRFPHRNEILGRASTPEETAFLEGRDSPF